MFTRITGLLPWLIIAGLAAVQTEAAMITELSGRISVDIGGRGLLESRQTGTGATPAVPSQCANDCNPISSVITAGCTTPSACCTSSFVNGFFSCFSCVGQAANLTDYTSVQETLDMVTEACLSVGVSGLPKLTFPGQNPNRPLSTGVPASGTSASTGTSTKAPGLPISTGTGFTQTTVSQSNGIPPQSTVSSAASTPTSPQITVSSLSSTTPVSVPTDTTSGARTMSTQYTSIALVSSTMLMALSFYLVL